MEANLRSNIKIHCCNREIKNLQINIKILNGSNFKIKHQDTLLKIKK